MWCLQNPFISMCVRLFFGRCCCRCQVLGFVVAHDLLTIYIESQHCYQFVWFYHDFFLLASQPVCLPICLLAPFPSSTQYNDSYKCCGDEPTAAVSINSTHNYVDWKFHIDWSSSAFNRTRAHARTSKINEVLCVSQLPHLFRINNKSLLMLREMRWWLFIVGP